ncbi:hypothetical protein Tco_0744843 [Tanacetum coccineum]
MAPLIVQIWARSGFEGIEEFLWCRNEMERGLAQMPVIMGVSHDLMYDFRNCVPLSSEASPRRVRVFAWQIPILYNWEDDPVRARRGGLQAGEEGTSSVAKAFKQSPRMVESRRSRDMSKYCHFHKDHGHESNQFRELRQHIEEAVKSGKLAHMVKGIKKGKEKASDTQLGKWKKGVKDIVLVEASILMVLITTRTHLPLDYSGWIPRYHSLDSQETILGLSERSNSPYNLLLKRTTMQKIGIIASTIHASIKFHTPSGIGTVFSTYEPNKVEEGQKKVKEIVLEVTKDVLIHVDAEERITVNDKYPEQTIVIGKLLPISFKKKLQDLL